MGDIPTQAAEKYAAERHGITLSFNVWYHHWLFFQEMTAGSLI